MKTEDKTERLEVITEELIRGLKSIEEFCGMKTVTKTTPVDLFLEGRLIDIKDYRDLTIEALTEQFKPATIRIYERANGLLTASILLFEIETLAEDGQGSWAATFFLPWSSIPVPNPKEIAEAVWMLYVRDLAGTYKSPYCDISTETSGAVHYRRKSIHDILLVLKWAENPTEDEGILDDPLLLKTSEGMSSAPLIIK